MGRLGKSSTNTARPIFKVHYRKLVDDYTGNYDTALKFVPALPDYLSYCCCQCGHTQKLQAEELNSLVGNAFRMAYAVQLQRQAVLKDAIAAHSQQEQLPAKLKPPEASSNVFQLNKYPPQISVQPNSKKNFSEMNLQINTSSPIRLSSNIKAPPNTIPGLRPMHSYNVLNTSIDQNNLKSQSQQSTPSSDESNSPTELNSYKRLTDKPPLIKRLAMGLTGISGQDDDSCPLVSESFRSTPESPTNRPASGGYENEAVNDIEASMNNLKKITSEIISGLEASKHIEQEKNRLFQSIPSSAEHEFKVKRISQISSSSAGSYPHNITESNLLGSTPTPPPLPERTDSLNNKEEGELRSAPWFQAGIPREITLEVLRQEPVGAFMVRESTSKPGCFALSLRVPRDFQPSGIAHYLILRTNKGFKIKGFTKEFTTLTSLITHHSVMQELLPCPLSLSRYNPSFVKTDSRGDFADVDSDPDYDTLADFRKMMADLNV